MKTSPMQHQTAGLERLAAAPEYFALGAEQGTGKTWMLLAEAEARFLAGDIECLMVVAPKGVHLNWVLREIPAHLEAPHEADYYSSGIGKRHQARLERLLRGEYAGERLIVLAINVDAFGTKGGREVAERFLRRFKCSMVIDESQRIKSPTSKRNEHIVYLGDLAVSRRIASGTLVADKPMDLFAQYDFLRPGLLGTTSYRTFVSEYAELLPQNHPYIVEMKEKSRKRINPQIIRQEVVTDVLTGERIKRPKYRNLAKLRDLIAPHTYRVLKKDCLDLPDKIYSTHFFELSPPVRRQYDRIVKELRYERDDGDVDIYTNLTVLNKLRQVTSGFINVDGEPEEFLDEDTRISALLDVVEDLPEGVQFIVWASFREEIRKIAEVLKDMGTVQYHGGVKAAAREEAVDRFQRGEVRVFIGNKAAAEGLTLTNAQAAIFYSQEFSLQIRSQSEDRCHRIGTVEPPLFIDITARNTVDEKITRDLQSKADTAAYLMDF